MKTIPGCKMRFLSALLGMLCFGAYPALGTLILYEGFDYGASSAALTNISATGIGWNGDWATTGTSFIYQPNDWFGSVPPAGGSASRVGGSANKGSNGSAGGQRLTADLSTSFAPGTSVWFSYLFAVRGDFSTQFDIGFASSTAGYSGIGLSISNHSLFARADGVLSTNSLAAPMSNAGFNVNGTNRSYFVVGRFDKGVGSGNDTLQLWINEGTNLLSESTFTMSGLTLAATPDRFSFNAPATTPGQYAAVFIDEIKIGTSAESIGVSVIPEPGSLALLGISFLALMARCRLFHGVTK